MGRPTDFTSELASAICERLADGESLRSICRTEGMPDERTVRGWVIDNREGFSPQYTRARDIGLDARADRMVEQAEAAEDAGLGRLAMDANRWYLSKMAPKRYGDKVEVEHAGEVKVTRVERRIVDPTHPNG